MKNENYEYKISYSAKGLIAPVITLIIFGVITILLYNNNIGAYIFTSIFTLVILAMTLYSAYATLFVKILIGKNSFYHQTAPGNGKSYEYSEILEAWESSGKSNNGSNTHYFKYKTQDGKVHKFLFYPYQYDEVDYLLEKINGKEEFADEWWMGL